MPKYRRSRIGSTYFFTVVTYRRRPILCLDASRVALRQAIADTRRSHPFAIVAWVLLPDHLHCIWELPEGDSGYSVRWAMIKKGFTQRVKGLLGAAKTTGQTDRLRSTLLTNARPVQGPRPDVSAPRGGPIPPLPGRSPW